MKWNWKWPDWPHLEYDSETLFWKELSFQKHVGITHGLMTGLSVSESREVIAQWLAEEAVTSSEIEGILLNKRQAKAHIQGALAGEKASRKALESGQGIAIVMADVFLNSEEPLTSTILDRWYNLLAVKDSLVEGAGQYRTTMNLAYMPRSGTYSAVSTFAPRPEEVEEALDGFIQWFNSTGSQAENPLPSLARAALAYIYFVTIQPYASGNYFIARALIERAVLEAHRHYSVTGFSRVAASESRSNEVLYKCMLCSNIDPWIESFTDSMLESQKLSEGYINSKVQQRNSRALTG